MYNRAYYEANREKVKASAKVYRETHPPTPEQITAKRLREAARYQANKERLAEDRRQNRGAKNAYNKEYRAKNRERLLAKDRERYANTQDAMKAAFAIYRATRRGEALARTIVWRQANPDRAKELNRTQGAKWYAANRSRKLATGKQWRDTNKAKSASYSRNRYARVKGAIGSHTAANIAAILVAQTGKCAYCRVKLGRRFHADHIMPIKLNGSNAASNIQILCATCNRRKSAKHPIEFARELGLLL